MNINFNTEQVIQLITILTFVGAIIAFFVKIGEFKTLINNDILNLKKDVDELKVSDKEKTDKISKLESETQKTTSRLETLLIEVKTRIEFFMQMSGFLNSSKQDGNERNKN